MSIIIEYITTFLLTCNNRRPKILAIPTRFDTEYIWTATAESLTVSIPSIPNYTDFLTYNFIAIRLRLGDNQRNILSEFYSHSKTIQTLQIQNYLPFEGQLLVTFHSVSKLSECFFIFVVLFVIISKAKRVRLQTPKIIFHPYSSPRCWLKLPRI